MKLDKYIKSTSQADFALDVGVTTGMVYQWLKNIRPVSPKLCVIIEQKTHGKVTRKDLRPDDWQQIWPELIDKHAA